jgi:hypothetical protein
MKFKIDWTKTYIQSGSIDIEAKTIKEAEKIVEENIGNYEGSFQYIPELNTIQTLKEPNNDNHD